MPPASAHKPRARAPKGTSGGRVWVPLTEGERAQLDQLAAQDERGASAMARQIYMAGLKAIGATDPNSPHPAPQA